MYVSNNLWCHFQQSPWQIGSLRWNRGRWAGIYTQKG